MGKVDPSLRPDEASIPKEPCQIETSLGARKKEGAITSTVRTADKKDEVVFNLKFKGEEPVLAEPPK